MKTYLLAFICLPVVFHFFQAEQPAANQQPTIREIVFKATFTTQLVQEKLSEVSCDDPESPFPNYQQGAGTATELGAFTTVMTFCASGQGKYGGVSGYMEAENGDRLFISIESGQVTPLSEPHPEYEAVFKDPFTITGGTGRFEGASGSGTTKSMVDLWNEEYPPGGPIIPDHRTDHEWTGTLVLPD